MLFIFIAHIFLKSWYCGIKLVYLLKGKIFSKGYVLKVSNRITFFLAGLDFFFVYYKARSTRFGNLVNINKTLKLEIDPN
tara:strand:- start:10633 stop:10872 length:240 start_codon:yes stop_codon:yes gene_type:complete